MNRSTRNTVLAAAALVSVVGLQAHAADMHSMPSATNAATNTAVNTETTTKTEKTTPAKAPHHMGYQSHGKNSKVEVKTTESIKHK